MFGLIGVFALVLAALLAITWPHEPKYHGKALSTYLTQPNLDREEVAKVFRERGRDSWPIALRFLKADKSSWNWRLRVLITKQPVVKIGLPPEPWYLSEIGSIGFEALVTNAAPAIPQLAKMLKQPRYTKRAAEALICTGPACLPIITNLLKAGTPTERAGVIFALTQLWALSGYVEYSDHSFWLRPVIPPIVKLANDPAMNISSAALEVMNSWPTNELQLPDLEFLSRSPNWGVRHSVVQWLRPRYPNSPETRVLLVQATHDPYWLVQRSAEDALRTLSPSR